jgi:predicted transcriptional regulator
MAEKTEEQTTYTIQELYDDLPITLVELSQRADLNEVTVARIRDGKPSRRTSVNRLLLVLSDIYKKPLSLKNVTGINVQINKRLEKHEAKNEGHAELSSGAA